MRVVFDEQKGQRVPIRIWAREISDETLQQLTRLACQPYAVGFVAAMADAHVSSNVAVGTVFATEDALVPGALGGDLGCGMTAARIADHVPDRKTLERIVVALGRAIPAGQATHRGKGVAVPDALFAEPLSTHALDHAREALAGRHLGTLGGGNHFVELDRDVEGALWLLVHSGSRGLGAGIFMHYTGIANSRRAPENSRAAGGLAGLSLGEDAGAAYARDQAWALDFARANRRAIADKAKETIADHVALCDDDSPIDIHHNFVQKERWLGRDLFIHRKGAVGLREGQRALVPGSMGTASYIVEGRGAIEAFGSCSHGAGRVLTRTEARGRITTAALAHAMKRVVYPAHLAKKLVEEAPAAYRDIREVLDDQEDLVVARTRLEPVAVLKG